MIKNDRQYKITRTQAEKFRKSVSDVREKLSEGAGERDSLKWKLQHSALEAQLADLDAEVRGYESLQEKRNESLEITSLDELPSVLIKARIASGLTQKQLATKVEVKEQQIQRYEATDYAGASLQRIQQIIEALGVKLQKQLFIPEVPVTADYVFKRLKDVGFNQDFINRRLISSKLRAQLEMGSSDQSLEGLVFNNIANISRVFGWEPNRFLSNGSLDLDSAVVSRTRFKMPASVRRSGISAYTVYAHYLALLCLQSTPNLVGKPVPSSWRHIRAQILGGFGELNLINIVRYAWDLGIVILPLKDTGQFHGATWRVRGRNIIVIKQQTEWEARWIIDLLHELWHAAQKPELSEHSVVEEEPPYSDEVQLMEEEDAANFAADVVFQGRSDDLALECAVASNKRTEWLKSAVQKVAAKHSVRADLLANYMAYRMSLEDQDWWSTAAKLQSTQVNPWQEARDFLVGNLKWDALNDGDRSLLAQALETREF
jgi:transcriptional regulator with XRE-family HTH domain